jgi:hypothetical protein
MRWRASRRRRRSGPPARRNACRAAPPRRRRIGQQHRGGTGHRAAIAADVEAEQDGNARDADREAGEAPAAHPLGRVEAQRQQRDEERVAGQQDPGQRRPDPLLAPRDEQERRGDVDHREGHERRDPAAQRPEPSSPHRERQQDECTQQSPDEDQRRGRHLLDGNLDQQERAAQEQGDRDEQAEGPSCHGSSTALPVVRTG